MNGVADEGTKNLIRRILISIFLFIDFFYRRKYNHYYRFLNYKHLPGVY